MLREWDELETGLKRLQQLLLQPTPGAIEDAEVQLRALVVKAREVMEDRPGDCRLDAKASADEKRLTEFGRELRITQVLFDGAYRLRTGWRASVRAGEELGWDEGHWYDGKAAVRAGVRQDARSGPDRIAEFG